MDFIQLKVKSKSGAIVDLPVLELLEVDGKPFRPIDDSLHDFVIHIDGRLTAVESVLSSYFATSNTENVNDGC